MLNFFHNYNPSAVAFSLGPIDLHWYGLIVVIGIIAGMITATKLASIYNIEKDTVLDLSFYLIIFSIIGARAYDVLLELPYYSNHPLDVFKLWQGGLAIHGAIIAGFATLYIFAKKNNLTTEKLLTIILPSLALGQAIGRFGNYFNQELFGKPTNLPWGIYINPENRPTDFLDYQYFQPTFFYESMGCLLIFALLIYILKFSQTKYKEVSVISNYFIGYSLLRFGLEFVRIDYAPDWLGLRWPQITSLLIVFATLGYILYTYRQTLAKK